MTDFERSVFVRAATKWGAQNEVTVAIEEMSELQKELCKLLRGRPDIPHIIEELADTYIMLDSICAFLGLDAKELARVRSEKVARLVDRIEHDGLN